MYDLPNHDPDLQQLGFDLRDVALRLEFRVRD